MLVAFAIRSIIGPPVFTPLNHPQPIVVFTEPSHFALAFLPFVGFFFVQLRGRRRWAVIVGALALSLLLKSTTLLVGILMILMSSLKWRQLVASLALCVGAALVANFDGAYIANRIVFSENMPNLSNLVLLQGWERAWLALQETNGLGLGFQQFGVWGPMGNVQDLIFAMAGDNLNMNDGGTTASKLVAEFGIFGIGLLFGWIVWWRQASSFLRTALRGREQPAVLVFMNVSIVTLGVELWVRGVGYFSIGVFLLGLIVAGRPVQSKSIGAVTKSKELVE
jgi:hypothetical protein